jgi:hypothetical protein
LSGTLQPRLMFVGKARAYPSEVPLGLPQTGAPEECFTWVDSDLTRKH